MAAARFFKPLTSGQCESLLKTINFAFGIGIAMAQTSLNKDKKINKPASMPSVRNQIMFGR